MASGVSGGGVVKVGYPLTYLVATVVEGEGSSPVSSGYLSGLLRQDIIIHPNL